MLIFIYNLSNCSEPEAFLLDFPLDKQVNPDISRFELVLNVLLLLWLGVLILTHESLKSSWSAYTMHTDSSLSRFCFQNVLECC